MLCGCLDWDTSLNSQTRKQGGANYPGQRRTQFERTAGNALAAPGSSPPIMQQQPPVVAGAPPVNPISNNEHSSELVAVTIQEGMAPGQMINVSSPDGTGRMVSVFVPQGLRTGETFMVEFPPGSTSSRINTSRNNNNNNNKNIDPQLQIKSSNTKHSITLPALPTAQPIVSNAMAVVPEVEQREPQAATPVSPSAPPFVMPTPLAPPVSAPPPMSNNYNNNNNNNNNNYGNNTNNNEKYVLVQVPPGTAPGTTLHVQIPGENGKIIAAQVPPGNVSQFHVSYKPFQQQQQQQQQQPTPVVQAQRQPTSEKLVLVQVPPGTAPGTTLHVQIPGENGRIIAAQVPPGNVSQFHVSYQPSLSSQPQPYFNNNIATAQSSYNNQNNNYPSNTNNPANGYNNSRLNSQGRNNLNRNNGYNNNGNGNNSRNSGSGVMGYVAPVLAGAALLGAAGYMVGHHNHQNQYENEGQNNDYDQSYNNHDNDNENNYENNYENNNEMENETPEECYDDAGGGDDFDAGGDY